MPATPVESREGEARERVAGIQRVRLLSAVVEVCVERGAANLTVSEIVGRAGVSRRTFYELFDDSEACLLDALDEAIATAAARVLEAYDPHARWRERIAAALDALLGFLDDEPEVGRLLMVESLAAGPRALERRARVLEAIIAAVDAGRAETKGGAALPSLTAEGVVGGALAVIHRHMLEPLGGRRAVASRSHEDSRMGALANPLMGMIVLPYLGAAAARREAARPVSFTPRGPRSTGKPLTKLGMRVTYRTMRVLAAIEELGGQGSYPSNRQVGRAAGIEDQGQVSKLLARLKRIELIENAGEDRGKGAPNAWQLTAKGREFQAAIEPHISRSPGASTPTPPWTPSPPSPRRRPTRR